MLKLAGVILNAAGVAALWFGGVPYTEKQKVVDLGPVNIEAKMEKRIEIPQPVGAGAVAVGTVLLLLPGGRKRS